MERPKKKHSKQGKIIFERALTLHKKNQLNEAISAYAIAINNSYKSSEAYNNMGVALKSTGAFQAAVVSYKHSIALSPKNAGTHSNLGNALRALGRYQEAETSHRQALEIDSKYVDARYNLGLVLNDQGKCKEGIKLLCEVIQEKPNYANAHWDLALALLLIGDLKRGFQQYEWRWRLKSNPPRKFNKPLWDGTPAKGNTILIHAEQGFGDSIQFVRYVPQVAKKGAEVILECQSSLIPLFKTLPGIKNIIDKTDTKKLPNFDLHAPLLSLPRIFRTDLTSIPSPKGYLVPSQSHNSKFINNIDIDRLNIGLAWAGKSSHRNDRNRSVALELFMKLLEMPEIQYHSLQIGDRANDIERLGCAGLIKDHSSKIIDFSDTADLISHLDLVITVDTVICHLAGALNIPCWVVVPYAPDWRWLMKEERSPWYESLRLFRQPRFGDWESVFSSVYETLKTQVTK